MVASGRSKQPGIEIKLYYQPLKTQTRFFKKPTGSAFNGTGIRDRIS
jgi:hypothetical protein